MNTKNKNEFEKKLSFFEEVMEILVMSIYPYRHNNNKEINKKNKYR